MPELDDPIVIEPVTTPPPPASEPAPEAKPLIYANASMRCVEADEFETAVQIEEQVEGEVKLHACTRKVYYYSFEGEDAFGRKIPGATLGVRVLFPLPFERGKLYKVELT